MNDTPGMLAPVIIMSFNRPQFLAPVLTSLKNQASHGVSGREVHLFQDGAINRYSHLRYADQKDIDASIALFRREFPEGVVHAAQDNIGICENFRRAEEYVFIERDFTCAWFFEDDLVLSPAYFSMMEKLQNFAENVGNVAYFAAYGNHYVPPEEILERRREVTTLDHHWGFGLLAHHWRSIQPQLQKFYDIVVNTDYSRRDHRKIFELYEETEGSPRASSQDAAKAFACSALGLWRCNTIVPFAKYIGTSGQHMTPEVFKEMGFDNATVSLGPIVDLQFPGPSGVREKILEQRSLFESVRRDEFDHIVAGLPATMLNPARACTRDDVTTAYQLLLRRRVESEAIFEAHASRRPVHVFVSSIIKSSEFLAFVDARQDEFTYLDGTSRELCSAEDIHNIYTLLCHREPEPAALEKHENKTFVDLLVQGVFRSAEWSSLNQQLVK